MIALSCDSSPASCTFVLSLHSYICLKTILDSMWTQAAFMTVVLKHQTDATVSETFSCPTGVEVYHVADFLECGDGWFIGPYPSKRWVFPSFEEQLPPGNVHISTDR